MTNEEKQILNDWITHREAYYKENVEYWENEVRLFPFPAVVSSYSNALLRYEVFSDFRNTLSVLLGDD